MAKPGPNVQSATCDLCGKGFKDRSGLSGHLQLKHSVDVRKAPREAEPSSPMGMGDGQAVKADEPLYQLDQSQASKTPSALELAAGNGPSLPGLVGSIEQLRLDVETLKRGKPAREQLERQRCEQFDQRVNSLEKVVIDHLRRAERIGLLIDALCIIASTLHPVSEMSERLKLQVIHTHRGEMDGALRLVNEVAETATNPRKSVS